jgi:hypothetical protein
MSQDETLVWLGPCYLSNGGELLEVHAPPIYPGVALVYSWPSRTRPAEPSSVDLVAEFDARAAQRREQNAAAFQAFDQQRKAVSPTRRKRRTKVQMQEARAAKAEQIAESYRALVPEATRSWLDAPDPMLDSILKSED